MHMPGSSHRHPVSPLHVPKGTMILSSTWARKQPAAKPPLLFHQCPSISCLTQSPGQQTTVEAGPFYRHAPHSHDSTGAVELSPDAGLVIWFHVCINAVLHHTAHTARHHIGTPVPAMGWEGENVWLSRTAWRCPHSGKGVGAKKGREKDGKEPVPEPRSQFLCQDSAWREFL